MPCIERLLGGAAVHAGGLEAPLWTAPALAPRKVGGLAAALDPEPVPGVYGRQGRMLLHGGASAFLEGPTNPASQDFFATAAPRIQLKPNASKLTSFSDDQNNDQEAATTTDPTKKEDVSSGDDKTQKTTGSHTEHQTSSGGGGQHQG
mmetsp:Transcript_75519/g.179389  ORF Transcript_75519/g.179389 Transcript_75519/m.179389 type:complete len:148 (+) Transcript_75519:98-541(+)